MHQNSFIVDDFTSFVSHGKVKCIKEVIEGFQGSSSVQSWVLRLWLGSVHLSSVHPLTASSCSFLVSFVRLHSLLLTNNEQAKCVRGTEQSEVNRAHKRSEWWWRSGWRNKGMNRENWSVSARNNPVRTEEEWASENHERREWASGGLFSSLLSSSLIHTHSVHYVHWVRWMWRRKRGRNRGVNEEKSKWVVSLTYSLLTVHHPLTFSSFTSS